MIYRYLRALKNFVHRHDALETIILFCIGLVTIVRTYRIFRTIRQGKSRKNYTVIVLGVRTIPVPGLIHFDALFAHAFRITGSNVKVLYHDGVLDSTDAETVFRTESPQRIVSSILGSYIKKALFVPTISYRQYISSSEITNIRKTVNALYPQELEAFMYLGVHTGLHAKTSTIRYFLSGMISLDNPQHSKIFRKKLINAIISTKVASEVVKQEKPRLLFLLHGIYSTWGPFLEYFQNQRIHTIMYGNMPSRFGYFTFYRNKEISTISAQKTWNIFKTLPLTKEQEASSDAYFNKRIGGKDGDQKMYERNFTPAVRKEQLPKMLSGKGFKKKFVMYTNLAWDVFIEGDEGKIFTDVFDWIDKTIEFFKKKKEYQLIIKPHPGELMWDKTSQGIKDYILEKFPDLPKNIVLLAPDVPLTAYDLLTEKTIGLVFNGSLGLDLATLGIPVLVSANIHYKDAGVVYPINTFGTYLSLLDNPEPLFSFAKKHITLAKKYAYFYYYKTMVRIPFYRSDVWSTIDWKVMANTKKLLALRSPLVKIAMRMIKGEDIVNPI